MGFGRTRLTSPSLRTCTMILAALCLNIIIANYGARAEMERVSCYDENNRPQRCTPEFVNAAFVTKPGVEATNTCGMRGVQYYCLQTGATGGPKSCGNPCDNSDFANRHPAKYLTDPETKESMTWWQSETMYEGNIRYPNSVNLTLHLRKSYDVTYIRLKFHSPRPESFAIYKKTREDGEWIPYQFYSGTCEKTYRRPTDGLVTPEDETYAICTDDYSDISPLTGAEVPFSTLEGRPSMRNFENSPILQEWVTATDIKIVLNRMNTFGDEVFGDRDVLRSYFYAITDIAVGGICKCNGHASECVKSTGQGLEERFVCVCEHNTMGPDCDQCEPFYNDRPWARASHNEANECLPCECNGLSNRCYFDDNLYKATGHGGHCLDCRDNTDGPNCERCMDNFYRRAEDNRCVACLCNEIGSQSLQCANDGRCACKPGVTGKKCDKCQNNYYDFSQRGCRQCSCLTEGSLNNEPKCSQSTGICECKENVEGQNCDRCKPNFFGLSLDNPYGCVRCFCYGHSSVCTSASGYKQSDIVSLFGRGQEGWTGVDRFGNRVDLSFNAITEDLGLQSSQEAVLYFSAPENYLGDQRFSYDQYLTFKLRVGNENVRASIDDVVIEGSGLKIMTPIYGQRNPTPSIRFQQYKFRLNEHGKYQWTPRLSAIDFVRLLSNVTAIKIRGTYSRDSVGFIDNVKLESAALSNNGGDPANWVEQCNCPRGYVGQFCESCEPGFRREPANGGPYARCVPCNCNGHSDTCDVNTGRCICRHNTVGESCERCAPGFYGYALGGTPDDCKRCPCPDRGSCVELLSGDVACIDCKEGVAGLRCDICADGYFGDPSGKHGPPTPCQKCVCSGNIDSNAVANCNTTTGECRKCIYNTGGFFCEKCLPGFYGDALASPKGQCVACSCNPQGTYASTLPACAPDGQCTCLPNVVGKQCDRCVDGYWNLASGVGCERCTCDRIGAYNSSCDLTTGQCYCKPGIGGLNCDQCVPEFYGFSSAGCTACQCDPRGSVSLQCDEFGQCPCTDSSRITGQQCDMCQENKHNLTAGCIDCPPCYNLVKEEVNAHRKKVKELRDLIDTVGTNPEVVDNTEFRERLKEVNDSVNALLADARFASGQTQDTQALVDLRAAIQQLMEKCEAITKNKNDAVNNVEMASAQAKMIEEAISNAEASLHRADKYLQEQAIPDLEKARQAFTKYGQQNDYMSDLSKMAREESTMQENDAAKIEELASKALNNSKEALRITTEALAMPDNTKKNIEKLRQDLPDLEGLYNMAKSSSDMAREDATKAYDAALSAYSDAKSLTIPNLEVGQMILESVTIKKEAEDLSIEANSVMNRHQDLIDDARQQIGKVEETLLEGKAQQQAADELLVDADVARAEAQDAVTRGEKTLKDAQNTLNTLKEFDQKVQDSKDKAEDALKLVPSIEDKIQIARNKTKEAEAAVKGAEADANMAAADAVEAEALAQKAAGDATKIQKEALQAQDKALQQTSEASRLMMELDDLEQKITEQTDLAKEDSKLAREALMKAGEAKTASEDANSKVQSALDTVNVILVQLADLDLIDSAKLFELEANLKKAEDDLKAANIDSRYQQLVDMSNEQQRQINGAIELLGSLEKDVANVQEIRDKLPVGCFKYIELEKGP